MIESLLHDSVTVLTMAEGEPDRYGSPLLEEASRKTYRAEVRDVKTTDVTDSRDTTTTDRMLMLAKSAVISRTSLVIWNGDTYSVVGEPEVKRRGPAAHHIEAVIRRVEG